MRRHRLSNIVDITANVAFSAGEDERIFYKTGALTAILSDLMERAGFCTRIHYFLGVRRGSNAVDTTT